MKIVLIGPVYPYKGGISHYTGLLCNSLREKHQAEMLSFKLQYPRFLFRKDQKDLSDDSFSVKDTKYLINTINPFNWIYTAKQIKKINPDAVIIQWWHPYFVPCYYIITKLLKKYRIVFTCHNVFPHERFLLDRFLTKLILKRGDCFIVHTHLDEKDLLSINPNAIYCVNPHPTYNTFKQEGISSETARDRLGVSGDTPILLFFGFVREYKGLKNLLKAMPMVISKIPDVNLWIVGDFGDDKQSYLDLINELNINKNLQIIDGYIPNKEVEKYFAAADIVVLPYESATGSGIAQIAYGFEKPVIATNVGGLPDIVKDRQTGYLVEPQNPELLAKAIIRYLNNPDESDKFRENIKALNKDFSWQQMTEQITALISRKNDV